MSPFLPHTMCINSDTKQINFFFPFHGGSKVDPLLKFFFNDFMEVVKKMHPLFCESMNFMKCHRKTFLSP